MKKTLILSTLLALLIDMVRLVHVPHTLGSVANFSPAASHATLTSARQVVKSTPLASLPGDSASDPVAVALSSAGLDPGYAPLYQMVQDRTGTPWQLLAAVHVTESHQASDTARVSPAGAIGPFQFLPSTWRGYGLDADGDGVARITDVDDAALTAGHYLAAGGAAHGNYSSALYRYNHSGAYVGHVLGLACRLGL